MTMMPRAPIEMRTGSMQGWVGPAIGLGIVGVIAIFIYYTFIRPLQMGMDALLGAGAWLQNAAAEAAKIPGEFGARIQGSIAYAQQQVGGALASAQNATNAAFQAAAGGGAATQQAAAEAAAAARAAAENAVNATAGAAATASGAAQAAAGSGANAVAQAAAGVAGSAHNAATGAWNAVSKMKFPPW